jgi:hypothetical protein
MNRSLTIAVLIIAAFFLTPFMAGAQHYNAWKLGANMGGTWQHSDIKDYAGIGWGVTVEKWKHQNQTNFFDYAWRFRYLTGTTYGKDHTRSYGIQNNPVFSDSTDTQLNYAQSPGFLYQNYKMNYHEFSLELLIGLNRLRERTGILLYGWGGIGVTGFQAKTDQLDAFGSKYNYTSIDSMGSRSEVLSDLNFLRDREYETVAEGNKSRNWRFAPSAGIGFGYQFTPVFAMVAEYKTTWPGTDLLDGQQWNNVNGKTGKNDHYHYGGLTLTFSLGGGKPKDMAQNKTDVNNYSNGNVNNNNNNVNNNVNNNNNAGNNNNNVVVNNPKPDVYFIDPSGSSASTQSPLILVTAKTEHVTSAGSVTVKVNGQQIPNFNFNSGNSTVSFNAALVPGSNTIEVRAFNNQGSDAATLNVNYSNANVYSGSSPAPVVTITYPSNPFNTAQSNVNVSATVLNVTSKSQIAVSINNSTTSNFTYDNNSKVVTFNASLMAGNNTVVVSATNNAGSDSKFVNINYGQQQSNARPVVTITSPNINPYNTNTSNANVTATVLNVASQANITVTMNNAPVNNFSYDVNTKVLSLFTNLNNGSNTVTITATNNMGSDTKSTTLVYNNTSIVQKPSVTITSPTVNPYTSTTNGAFISATVLNVSSRNNITILVNGNTFSGGTFNTANGQLAFNISLNPGTNTVMINASNSAGSDSKSTNIVYNDVVKLPAPVVTITSPNSNPFTSQNASTAVNATVTNVPSESGIEVKVNNVATTNYIFNKKTGSLAIPLSLGLGATVVSIKGTNETGSDTKTQTINFDSAPAGLPPIVELPQPSISNSRVGDPINIVGKVYNVTSQNQVTLKINGQVSSNWTFIAGSGKVILNYTLVSGNNVIELKATTPGGTDSKTISLNVAASSTNSNPQPNNTNNNNNPGNTSPNNHSNPGNQTTPNNAVRPGLNNNKTGTGDTGTVKPKTGTTKTGTEKTGTGTTVKPKTDTSKTNTKTDTTKTKTTVKPRGGN